MAKNSKPAPKSAPMIGKKPSAKLSSTPVRNTPIPKASTTPKTVSVAVKAAVPAAKPPAAKTPAAKPAVTAKKITHDDIAKRAYEIHQSGQGGSETDNWHRAERELRS